MSAPVKVFLTIKDIQILRNAMQEAYALNKSDENYVLTQKLGDIILSNQEVK